MSEKILFTDLDGTLLTGDKKIPPALQKRMGDFSASGGRLVYSTGRMLWSALHVLTENNVLFPNSMIIAANGNTVYDPARGECLMEKTVPLSLAEKIVRTAKGMGLHIQTYSEDRVICEKETPELLFYQKGTGMNCLLVPDIPAALKKPPGKLLAIDLNGPRRLLLLREEILSRFGDTLTAIFSCPEYLEIFDKTGGKGNAVRFVCEYLHLPLSASVAVGDAENDLSMLRAAGSAAAVANAALAVKELAGFVTRQDNDHGGLEEVFDRFFS